MRVCKIWDADYPWDIRVEKVSQSLVQGGHTVHLLCRNEARRPCLESRGRFVIHRLPALPPVLGPVHRLVNFPYPTNPVWVQAIARTVRASQADLMLVRDLPLALPAALVARAFRIPVVLDMAEHYAAMLADRLRYSAVGPLDRFVRRPGYARLTERLVLRLVDHVIVVVEESRERLVRMGVARERLTVVCNTPRRGQWEPVESKPRTGLRGEDELSLIYLGNLDGSRGIDVAIRGVRRLREMGCEVVLRVIGQGPCLGALRALAARLDVVDCVRIEGRLPYARVRSLLARAAIGIIPHYATDAWNATIPNKLFDYMLVGLPVLVSDARPTARIVREEGCGEVFRDRDPEDFARRVLSLAEPELRRAQGARGHAAVARRYHWDHDARRLLDAVETAGRPAAPRARTVGAGSSG